MMVLRQRGLTIRDRLLLPLFVAAAFPAAAAAQYSEHIEVHVIEVPAIVRDAKGEVPRDLTPADFELRENGVVQKIVSVDYAPGVAQAFQPAPAAVAEKADRSVRPTRERGETVIYLQQTLVTTPGLRESARALALQADALVRSADVEIVSDYPRTHVVARATSNAEQLRQALLELAEHGIGQEQLLAMRQRALQVEEATMRRVAGPKATAGALQAMEEQSIIRRTQTNFISWMLRYPRIEGRTSRALILVSDGFDYDQSYYDKLYRTTTDPIESSEVLHDSPYPARDQDTLARALAAEGWSIYCLAPGARWMSATGLVDNRRSPSAKMPFQTTLMKNVLGPLNNLAAESGGMVETDMTRVRSDIEKLEQRVVITYQVKRPRDDVARKIQIRPLRRGLTVQATRWMTVGTPESVNTARALTLAAGHREPGDLPVTCMLRTAEDGGESLDVRVDLTPIDAIRPTMHAATLRVAVAVTPEHALPFTVTERLEPLDLASKQKWDLTLPLKGRKGAVAAVSVEEPSSTAWGAARCELPGLQ